MRILIADDEPAFREFLEEILAKWGYEVVATSDGNEAWQALTARDAPRLAIVDWLMPGMDGVEICRRVRRELQEPYTYIILVTGQQQDEHLVAGMEAGADDYIAKPLKIAELRVRLNAGRRIVELQNDLLAANMELEAFNNTLSQDLRKPLKIIDSYCAIVMQECEDKLNERCKGYIQETCTRILRMNRLIATLLHFSRMTQLELHRESVDLSAIVKELARELRLMEPERRATFRIAEGIKADGDANLLRVVLDNLLGNAWKYTGTREEAVIEFGATEVEGNPACFIRDNGIGFDMTYAHRLFTPFQPLPGTEEYKGQGIGLVTVERILRRHGGRVWAKGEPGKGATFYFTLRQD